jgi:hypothetical protein
LVLKRPHFFLAGEFFGSEIFYRGADGNKALF